MLFSRAKKFPFLLIRHFQLGADFLTPCSAIYRATNVIVIVTQGCFDRCHADNEDWLRQEIRCALQWKKHLIPLIDSGVTMPTPSELPRDISDLAVINGKKLAPGHFTSTIEQ